MKKIYRSLRLVIGCRYFLSATLFAVSFLCPASASAQDDLEDEEEEVVAVRKITPVQKKYKTRTIKGVVTDAATGAPLIGALVSAHGILQR